MKILCVSDHVDPLVYSERIKDRFNDVDLILGAGDLPISYYEYIISCLNKPLYFIFGNHNLKRYNHFRHPRVHNNIQGFADYYKRPSFGSIYIDRDVHYSRSENLIIAGLGGCRKYNSQLNQFSEFGMFLKILRIVPKLFFNRIFRGRYLDILLTHTPPRGVGDRNDPCHKGFKIFRTFLRFFKPAYMIHGHIHLYDKNKNRTSLYYHTRVVNAYDHIVIELKREQHG